MYQLSYITIVWIAVSVIWALIHANKINSKQTPGGAGDMFLRIFAGWVFGFWIAWNIPYPEGLYVFGLSLIYLFGVFWLAFDLALNYYRFHTKITYVSTANGKFLDKIFKGSFAAQLTVKIIVIISSLIGVICVS